MGRRAATGFAFTVGQIVAGKAAALCGQVVLGRLLAPEHFGVMGLALTVTAFAGLVQEAGLGQILVHRHAQFRRWATPVFWISLGLGLATGLLVAAAAPVAARVYRTGEVAPLLLILAAAAPLNAMGVVPNARLLAEMRFRTSALIGTALTVAGTGLTVVLAARGFGPYSLAIPVPALALARAAALWAVAAAPIRMDLQVGRWRHLLPDGSRVACAALFATVTMQADYVILGLRAGKAVVGTYFFGFNLSMQATALLTAAVSTSLFPTLSALRREPDRQVRAFRQVARVMATGGVPLCLLQAALADPVIRLLFGAKWEAAIPVVQILSVGMAVQLLNGAASSLLQAQGRFTTFLKVAAGFAVMMPTFVLVGAWRGSAVGTAVAASLSAAVAGVVLPYVALRPAGATVWDICRVYATPLACGGAAAFGAAVATRAVPVGTGYWAHAVVTVGAFAAIYVPLISWMAPQTVRELVSLASGLARRGAGDR